MTSGPIKITIPEIFVKIVSFNSADSATAASAITNSERNWESASKKTYSPIVQFKTDSPANGMERTFAPQLSIGYDFTIFKMKGR